jgi:predicted PurR-regulated permease PerM
MKTRRTFVFLTAIVLVCAAFFWLAASKGVEKTYEVHTLPEYRSDTARAIDANQQIINRMLDDNHRNWLIMQNQLNAINSKLDKILGDLDNLSVRIARIEKKLGIEEAPKENEPQPGELQQQEIQDKTQQPQQLN